jgi:DNA topoisomerase III
VSHHAIVANVNVLDDLEQRIARLIDDEKRLLALICRSYLAAVMPDYEYRQTVATMRVPVPGGMAIFRAVGRIPLKQGWKAVYGATEPEPEKSKEGDTEAEQTLPQLTNGERATLTHPCVDAKKTQPALQ